MSAPDGLVRAVAEAIELHTTDVRWSPKSVATAALAAHSEWMRAEGKAVVPVEPTEAMIDAFVSRALNVTVAGDGGWSEYGKQQWSAMLTAAQS